MEGLLEGDLEIVAKVRAPFAAGALTAAPAAHHVAEQVVEDVGHRSGEAVAHAAHAAVLEGRVPVPVVCGPLLRVGQGLVGFVDFLEARLGLLVAGMAVGMAAHRRFAEGGLQLNLGHRLGHAQDFVEVPLRHLSAPFRACTEPSSLQSVRPKFDGPPGVFGA